MRHAAEVGLPRRRLSEDELSLLIREWKLITRNGKDRHGLRQVGELFQFVGWAPDEMAHYQRTGELPYDPGPSLPIPEQ